MRQNSLIKWVVLIGILVLPFLVYYLFVYNAEENFFVTLDYVGEKTPVERVNDQGETVIDTNYYKVPGWSFTSQYDTTVSEEELRGNILLVNFFFTSCPSICPAMNYNVKQVQDRFKGYENFKIVSFSVDPEHDTVEVLQEYARDIGATPGRWYFLTGDKDEIYATARDYFANAMEDSLAEGGFLHSENLVLVDWEGRLRSGRDDQGNLRGVYTGTNPHEVNEMKSDIKVLIAEYEKKKSMDEYKAGKEKMKKDE